MVPIGRSGPVIETSDVALFYTIYDAAQSRPDGETLQRDYLEAGSEGLRAFAQARATTGARIAAAIEAHPLMYEAARSCAASLPGVRDRLAAAMRRLGELYPEARFPAVTIAVGRGRPVAIGSPVAGVQIGLEALCAANFLNADVEARFVYVIAHEFAHVQQRPELADGEDLTVLEASLMEGAAEFVAELTAGDVAYGHLRGATVGREREIETAFLAEMESRDLSNWLYNTTVERQGDLGYWVGYRIVRSYYESAQDKRAALRDIIEMTDAHALLAASGWTPGMRFD